MFELTRFISYQFIDIDSVHAAKYLESEGKDSEKRAKSTVEDAPMEPSDNDEPATEDEIKDLSKLFKGPPLIYTGIYSDGVSLKELTALCLRKGLGDMSCRALGRHLKRNTGKTNYSGTIIERDGVKCRGIRGWKINKAFGAKYFLSGKRKGSKKRAKGTVGDHLVDEIKDFSKLFEYPPLIYTGLKSDGVSLKELTALCLRKGLGNISSRALGRQLRMNTGNTKYSGMDVMRDGVKCRGIAGWKIAGT